ncbi:MAG: hypothetical protein Q4C74_06910 [Rothia sp. (in: high G+C Gram-positive bacteria)]|nr:hypothetical protein [Rothia sp. (in: high G+C Gram-positive bacteria)]
MRSIRLALAGIFLALSLTAAPAQAAAPDTGLYTASSSSQLVAENGKDLSEQEQQASLNSHESGFADFTNAPTIIAFIVGLAIVGAVATKSVRAAAQEENQNR